MIVSVERERLTQLGVSPRVKARLQLDFEFDSTTGRTVLRSCKQQPPMRVVRAFALEDGAAMAHLHNLSGGLLGGDQLELVVNVASRAAVQLTTTGATRVYRALNQFGETVQANSITIAENGLLEYVPDPIIPFAGACLRQSTSIRLASGAGLFWWDVVAPGREARGEIFAYEYLELKIKLQVLGRWIAAESVRLEPAKRRLASPGRMGVYRYCATFYICRVGVNIKMWLDAEEHLRRVAADITRPTTALWGVSALPSHGLIVRGLTVHGQDVIAGLRTFWQTAKSWLFGSKAILPRKIN